MNNYIARQTYMELGLLLFQTGIPQLFGLSPADDLFEDEEAREALVVMMGMLQSLVEHDHLDPYLLPEWRKKGEEVI